MRYKTYNKKPTKYRQKESKVMLSILICLVIGAGLINALVSKINTKMDNVSEVVVTPLQSSPIASQTILDDYLSDGTRVIKTKTKYFENETQVWLASEQACKWVGLGDKCVNDMMGMGYAESRSFNYKAMGDGNKSYGAFQIHLGYHPDITKEQALDPYWSAKWTIKRMLAYDYLTNRDYAIQKHNGTPGIPATLTYLSLVNKYINM